MFNQLATQANKVPESPPLMLECRPIRREPNSRRYPGTHISLTPKSLRCPCLHISLTAKSCLDELPYEPYKDI